MDMVLMKKQSRFGHSKNLARIMEMHAVEGLFLPNVPLLPMIFKMVD